MSAVIAAWLLWTAVKIADEQNDVVRILNDSPRVVTIRLCRNDDCSNGFDPPHYTLTPGDVADIGVSTSGVPNVYLVLTVSDDRLGCLPLVMPEPVRGGLDVGISAAVPCRKGLDEDVQWPPPVSQPSM